MVKIINYLCILPSNMVESLVLQHCQIRMGRLSGVCGLGQDVVGPRQG